MKIRKGVYRSKLPPIGLYHSAHLELKESHFSLMCIRIDQLMAERNKHDPVGIPTYMAIDDGFLYLLPRPGQAMELKLRYYPPVREI